MIPGEIYYPLDVAHKDLVLVDGLMSSSYEMDSHFG